MKLRTSCLLALAATAFTFAPFAAAQDPAPTATRIVRDDATGLSATVPAAWEIAEKTKPGQILIVRASPYDGDPKDRPALVCMGADMPGATPESAPARIEDMLDKTWRLAPPEEKVEIAPVAREDLSGGETWRTRVHHPRRNETMLILVRIHDEKMLYCSAGWAGTHSAEMEAVWKSLAVEPAAAAK